jgi:hypothetical protein
MVVLAVDVATNGCETLLAVNYVLGGSEIRHINSALADIDLWEGQSFHDCV